mmetsp:Transcript_8340/g.4954  ORF Transcript_8340/g.4954 Transcript_8340/m.4954 type:complete len:299 (+) Transcript_8340:78-974(+)
MPRGWLKNKSRRVGKKASRGGSSHNNNASKQRNCEEIDASRAFRPTRHSKPHRVNQIHEEQSVSCLSVEDFVYEHDEECAGTKPSTSPIHDEKECPICCEIRPLVSLMKKCNHPPACRECLHEIYVSQAQENVSNYPLQCYHPECSKPILASQLISHSIFGSEKEIQKHYRFSLLAKAYSDFNTRMLVHCPDCDFPKLVYKQERVHCKKCKSKFEVTYDAKHNKLSTIKALEAMKKDNIGYNEGWTFCPGCKMIVSKGEGCYHMTCVCGEEFYWDEVTIKPNVKMVVAERPSECRVTR